MKNKNRKILYFILILVIILLFSISAIIFAYTKNKENSLINQEKIYCEIKYLDSSIIKMSNSINLLDNTVYSSNLEIDWVNLLNNIETVYQYWNTTILDLNNLLIDKQDLTDFGKILDNLVISTKEKNKQQSFNYLVQLYEKLTIYAQNIEYDVNYTQVVQAKYHLLVACSIAEKGNWTLIYESILKSDEALLKIVNSFDNKDLNEYNVNQAFVAVKELENIINVKDLDVFYLKYKIAMQKLENI